MHLHKCDHVNFFLLGGGGGVVVRLTAKPRYLLLHHRGKEKSNTVTALHDSLYFSLRQLAVRAQRPGNGSADDVMLFKHQPEAVTAGKGNKEGQTVRLFL